jgi:transporter family protein
MKSYLFSILAALFWGMAPVLEKMGLSRIPPLAGIFVRSIVSAFLCAVIFSTFYRDGWGWVFSEGSGKGILLLVISGISSALIGQFFYFSALKMGEASVAVGIASTYPLVAFFLSLIFLGESLTLYKVFGILLIVSGIIILTSKG